MYHDAHNSHTNRTAHMTNTTEIGGNIELTEEIASIIRRCWQSDPLQRPDFKLVIQLLLEQRKLIEDATEAAIREEYEEQEAQGIEEVNKHDSE